MEEKRKKEGLLDPSEYHLKITAAGIREGILAFTKINNMTATSCDKTFTVAVDLHRLLNRYLTDLDAREKINKIIGV